MHVCVFFHAFQPPGSYDRLRMVSSPQGLDTSGSTSFCWYFVGIARALFVFQSHIQKLSTFLSDLRSLNLHRIVQGLEEERTSTGDSPTFILLHFHFISPLSSAHYSRTTLDQESDSEIIIHSSQICCL